MTYKNTIIIKQDSVDQRLDKFLVSWVGENEDLKSDFSRGDLIRLIKDGKIRVNGAKTKPSYCLREGDVVEVEFEEMQKTIVPNKAFDVEVVYEDDDIVVVSKQSGVCVHPSNEREKDTLVNALLEMYPEISGIGDESPGSYLRPGIVHRLDKDTSGVMVVARNQKSFDELKRKFQNREVLKTYQAVVYGDVKKNHFVVSDPIARATSYKRQVIAGKRTKTKIREAVTEFFVLERFSKYTFVEARPKTGRMHQIRVHLLSVGNPIVGDKLYQKKEFLSSKFLSAERQLLHAKEIEFELFGKDHKFDVQLPMDFVEFLEIAKQ